MKTSTSIGSLEKTKVERAQARDWSSVIIKSPHIRYILVNDYLTSQACQARFVTSLGVYVGTF